MSQLKKRSRTTITEQLRNKIKGEIQQGYTQESIAAENKVSRATVARISQELNKEAKEK